MLFYCLYSDILKNTQLGITWPKILLEATYGRSLCLCSKCFTFGYSTNHDVFLLTFSIMSGTTHTWGKLVIIYDSGRKYLVFSIIFIISIYLYLAESHQKWLDHCFIVQYGWLSSYTVVSLAISALFVWEKSFYCHFFSGNFKVMCPFSES